MNLLFTICARAGSKGVQNKNIRDFCEIPLIKYTLASFLLFCEKYGNEYEAIDLAINTDSKELIDQINSFKMEYLWIKRKDELAGDTVSKISVIKDTMCEVEKINLVTYDYIIDLDLTSPLRRACDIKGTLDIIKESSNADIAYSVTDARRSPYFNMVCKDQQGFYNTVLESEYVCRQQSPQCFDMNASIYVYARKYLLTEKMGKRNALIWKMKDTGILDIDSEEDLELMQVIGAYFFERYDEYSEIKSKAMEL